MKTTTEIIAKEGWKFIAIALLGLGIAWLSDSNLFIAIFFVACLCLVYFYRNPERIAEDIAENSILAPIDGVIKEIKTQDDGIYLSIKKPICFCGLLRMPFAKAGKCAEAFVIEHVKGLKSGDSCVGERVVLLFKRDIVENLESTKVAQLTLYPKGQIALYLWDSNFKLGERLGFFLRGKADFKIPLESELKVNIGDRIYSGATLIATMTLEDS